MKTISTIATVTADGKVTLQLPPDITPGKHQVVLVIDEDIKTGKPETNKERLLLNFLTISVGSWPDDLSLRREDMYDEWGR